MNLSFIGMSNIGKSYWTTQLSSAGLRRISCDDLIKEDLNVEDLSSWMGQPPEEKYVINSEKYLSSENEVMKKLLSTLCFNSFSSSIDTSGSVIYTDTEILDKLKSETKIVYLESSKDHHDFLYELYKSNPKPLIWKDTNDYLELLMKRKQKYEELAAGHITIPFDVHRSKDMTVQGLIDYIMPHIK